MSHLPVELYSRSTWRSLVRILRVWLALFGLLAFACHAHGAAVLAVVFILIGILQYHLNVLGHDGLHASLSKRRAVNDALCRWLLHGPVLSPLSTLRANHLNHHQSVGETSDGDAQYYDLARFPNRLAFGAWFLCSLVGGMSFGVCVKLLSKRGKSSAPIGQDLASIALWQFALLATTWKLSGGPWVYALFWVVPIFTVMMGLNTMRSCLEHASLVSDNRARSFLCGNLWGPLERWLLAPYNMNMHAEHHAYPAVPFEHLPQLSSRLPVPRVLSASYAGRLGEIFRRFPQGESCHEL